MGLWAVLAIGLNLVLTFSMSGGLPAPLGDAASSRILTASPSKKVHEVVLNDLASSHCFLITKWEFTCPNHLVQTVTDHLTAHEIDHKFIKIDSLGLDASSRKGKQLDEVKFGYDDFRRYKEICISTFLGIDHVPNDI